MNGTVSPPTEIPSSTIYRFPRSDSVWKNCMPLLKVELKTRKNVPGHYGKQPAAKPRARARRRRKRPDGHVSRVDPRTVPNDP